MSFSPLRNHDVIFAPLVGSQGDAPSWVASGQMNFQLSDIPAVTDGKLCNHLAGIMLQFEGTLNNAGSGASAVFQRDLTRALLSDVQIDNAWHGTPISANFAKGSLLNPIEWASSGFRLWNEGLMYSATFNGTFKHIVFLPLMAGAVLKSHHTALPAVLYKNASLKLNNSAASVLTGISTLAAFSGVTCRAHAVLIPQSEVTIGPGVEWVRYAYPVASTGEVVKLDSFGNSSGLVKTEADSALLNLFWMSSLEGQGGAGLVENISRISIPFRAQTPLLTVMPYLARMNMYAQLDTGIEYYSATAAGSWVRPYPYQRYITSQAQVAAPNFLPVVMSPPEMELTKAQTVGGTTSMNITAQSLSGEHVLLAQHARSWTPEAYESAKEVLIKERIAQQVCGTDDVVWVEKMARKQTAGELRDDQMGRKVRYLPSKLIPRSKAA